MLQGEDINEFLREQARLYGEPDDDFTDFNEALLEQANKMIPNNKNEDTTEVLGFTLD